MQLTVKSVFTKALALAQAGTTAAKQGAIAALAATAIIIAPITVKAQNVPFADLFPILSGVEMTTQQKIQLAELSSQTLNQAEKIVTSQQRDQFRKALADGKGFGEALAAMDITSDQQTQLKTLFSSTQTQLISLLTPAQRQQILENMRSILQLAPTQSSTQSPTP